MSRKRFNPNRLYSSETYTISCRIHREFIQRFHHEHVTEIHQISSEIKVRSKFYVSCFGRLVEVTEAEANELKSVVNIIVK